MGEKILKEKLDMLNKIYNVRQEDLEENANEDRRILAEKLNNTSMEKIEEILKNKIKEDDERQKLLKQLDELIENYEIKMAYYAEKNYKQGFKDAIKLYMQCSQE